MTDDEAITLALLHGCKFAALENSELFYVENTSGKTHAIEAQNYSRTGLCGFKTRELLAHAYCEHFGLGMDVAATKTHKEDTST